MYPVSARSHCSDTLFSFLHGAPSFLMVLAFYFARAEVMVRDGKQAIIEAWQAPHP